MKKLVTFFAFMLIYINYSQSNPIMPESLIAEVYFENDDWYLAIDNELLFVYGIEDFENIQIFCNDGQLIFVNGFLPDLSVSYTIITNDNLINPVEIERSGDIITSSWYDPVNGNIGFTTLAWNDVLPSPVFGPLEGQSLSIVMIPVEEYIYEWWLVKNSNPYIFGWPDNTYGTFAGCVLDINHIPVPNARIDYIESYYIEFPYNVFDTLITNDTGYFSIPYMPARNYYITKIVKNNMAYFINDYISIEPDSVNFYEFNIDYIVGQPDVKTSENYKISNFPNPTNGNTEFVIDCKGNQPPDNAYIKINDINGKKLTVLPVSNPPDGNGQIKINWQNQSGLEVGNFIYTLIQGDDILATGKMMITK
ncbi:MAG: hypothetical protein R2764_20215 [Bacteroidales bacterium]